jgi:H+/Cl- antiporter ClcA
MPDYSIVKPLCQELHITISELFDGEESEMEQPLLDLLARIQTLETQKQILLGVILIVMGMSLFSLSPLFHGTDFQDFLSGLFNGLAMGVILIGVFVAIRNVRRL